MLALPGSAYLYQGEELGLPEHTALDDDLRQDPTWVRSGQTIRGRDGCRVPLPWEADRPGARVRSRPGRPGCRSRSRSPAWPATLEAGDPDSTLQMYRAALRLRRERGLGDGDLEWLDASGSAARPTTTRTWSRSATAGSRWWRTWERPPSCLPAGDVLLASAPLPGDGTLPGDTTVWLG